MTKTLTTLEDAKEIYEGLGFTEEELKAEVEQANFFGMREDYKKSPEQLLVGYASNYRYEMACEDREARDFEERAYGRD